MYCRPNGLLGLPVSSPKSSWLTDSLKPYPRIGSHSPPFLGLTDTVLEPSGLKPPKRPPAFCCIPLPSNDRCSKVQTWTPEERRLGQEIPDKKVAERLLVPEIPTAAWLKGPGHPALTLARPEAMSGVQRSWGR